MIARFNLWIFLLAASITGAICSSNGNVSRTLQQRDSVVSATQPFRAEGSSKSDFVLEWDEAACRLKLPLMEDSNALFTGRISAPETDQLDQKKPSKSLKVHGALELSYPNDCPQNYDELLVSLNKAKFSGGLETANLLFENVVAVSKRNNLELSFHSLRIAFETSVPLRLHNGQFGAAFKVNLIGGKAFARNKRATKSMKLIGSTFGAGSGRIEQEGQKVTLTIPNLAFSFSVRPKANESFPVRMELAFTASIFSKVDFMPQKKKQKSPQLKSQPIRLPEQTPKADKNKQTKTPKNSPMPSASPEKGNLTFRDPTLNLKTSPLLIEDVNTSESVPDAVTLSQNPKENEDIYVLEIEMDRNDLTIAAGILATPILLGFLIFLFLISYIHSQWSKYYTYYTQDMNGSEVSEKEGTELEESEIPGEDSEFQEDSFQEIRLTVGIEPAKKLIYEDLFCAVRVYPIKEKIRQWKASRGLLPKEKKTGWETLDQLALFQYEGHQYKTILHKATGALPSGELTAILGPSDSGKALFVRLLAGNVSQFSRRDIIKGSIHLDGRQNQIKRQNMNVKSALVMEDIFHENALTMSEILGIWIGIKGPWGHTISDHKIRSNLNEAIRQMDLLEKHNTRIGSLTLLEKKKLMVACEMAKSPTVLFLQDVLQGLDAHDTLELMLRLRKLAEKDRIVTLTMNQASPDQFELIDHLLIMSNGHLLYDGPIGQINAFFTQVGHPCPNRIPISAHILTSISEPSVLHRLICLVKNAYETRDANALMSILSTKDFLNTCALESGALSFNDSVPTDERALNSNADISRSRNDEIREEVVSRRQFRDDAELSSFQSLRGFWKSVNEQQQRQFPMSARDRTDERIQKTTPSAWKQVVLKNKENKVTGSNDPPFAETTWSFSDSSVKQDPHYQSRRSSLNSMVTFAGPQRRSDAENSTLDSFQTGKRTSNEGEDSFFATTETDLSKIKISDVNRLTDISKSRVGNLTRTIPLVPGSSSAENTEARENTGRVRSERLSVVLGSPVVSHPVPGEGTMEMLSHPAESVMSGTESTVDTKPANDFQVMIEHVPAPLPSTFPFQRTAPLSTRRVNEISERTVFSDPGTSDYSHPEAMGSPVVHETEETKTNGGIREMFADVSDRMVFGMKIALLSLGLVRSTRSLWRTPGGSVTVSRDNTRSSTISESERQTQPKTQRQSVICEYVVYDNHLTRHTPESEWASELAVLLLTNIIALFRNKTGVLLHMSIALVCGLLMSILYLDLDEDINGMQSRTSAVFFTLSILTVASIIQIVQLGMKRNSILQDVKSEIYRPSSFVIAHFLPDLMFLKFCSVCLFSLSFLFIARFSLGFNRVIIFIFGLTVFWATLHYTFLAIALSSPNRSGVYVAIAIVALYGLLFCGYLISKQDLYGVIRLFTAISPMCNAFEMIVISQLSAYAITTTVATSEIEEFEDSLGHASHISMGLRASRVFKDAIVLMTLLLSMVFLVYGVIKWHLLQRHLGNKKSQKLKKKQSLLRTVIQSSRTLLIGQENN